MGIRPRKLETIAFSWHGFSSAGSVRLIRKDLVGWASLDPPYGSFHGARKWSGNCNPFKLTGICGSILVPLYLGKAMGLRKELIPAGSEFPKSLWGKRYICQRSFQTRRAICAVFRRGVRISFSRLPAGRCIFAALAACMSSRFSTTAQGVSPTITGIPSSTELAFPRASFHRDRQKTKTLRYPDQTPPGPPA